MPVATSESPETGFSWKPLHILVICTHFPPLNRTGARRPYYIARQLRDEGHHVSVLTSAETEDATWNVDLSGIRVIRCPHSHVQRDMRPWQRLIAKGHHGLRGSIFHGPLRVLADVTLPLDHATRWDVALHEITDRLGAADVIVATGPSWSPAHFGMRLARKWNATFLVDYRDPWNISDPTVHMGVVSGHGKGLAGYLRRKVYRKAERQITGAAYALTAVSTPVLHNAQDIGHARLGIAISGGFDPDLDPGPKGRNSIFTMAYTGRLYPEQDWDMLLEGLQALSHITPKLAAYFRLRLIGPVCADAKLLDHIQRFAQRSGLVELIPRTTHTAAMIEQQKANALLHLAYRGKRGYLPVKFLEYLNAGRPIVLISHENDLMEETIVRTRTGVIIRSVDQLVELLRRHVSEWRDGATWTIDPDKTALAEFSYPERMKQWVRQIEVWHAERISG